ncbi:MAG TPA: MT-A70 family methyltransferase [Clostridiaceae bacterium]|nr:MT-A70 family methyltransferase [Clostridiaceae bacterium]
MIVDIEKTDKKYNIIYADPPWKYKVWNENGRTAGRHYPTMAIEDIIKMKDTIQRISDENCILFLWVTFPCLLDGLRLIKEWGFTYKTCGFNWVKRNKKSNSWFFGMGYWTRANSELCLIATKGNIKRISKSVFQIVDTHIEEHSKKPDEVRKRIVELVGDLPRIELFARQTAEGWDSWGNELPKESER